LDFVDSEGEIKPQHYAFLVSETEFDQIFARIEQRRLPYWADPHKPKPDQINHWDDGTRGLFRRSQWTLARIYAGDCNWRKSGAPVTLTAPRGQDKIQDRSII
jgi:hypothetical protein